MIYHVVCSFSVPESFFWIQIKITERTVSKGRELAEMGRWAFHDLLGEERIQRRCDIQELEDDLKTVGHLG
jgi:hypothetical protein